MINYTFILFLSLFIFWAGSFTVNGQQQDSVTFKDVWNYDYDALDTTSLIGLLDSPIKIEEQLNKSSLIFFVGYNSTLTSAGRIVGVDQPGYNLGASYYHKSNLYANVVLFINGAYSRDHYLTTATLGYMDILGKNWIYNISFDRFFYHDGDSSYYHPLNYSVNAGLYYQLGKFSLDLDYSYYFGDENGHQVIPGISGSFYIHNAWIFDKVSFMPSFNLLFGSNVTTSIIPSPENRLCRFRLYRWRNTDKCFGILEDETFGLLNSSIIIPLSFYIGDFSLATNYVYNIPRVLEDDWEPLNPYGFYRLTLSYYLR